MRGKFWHGRLLERVWEWLSGPQERDLTQKWRWKKQAGKGLGRTAGEMDLRGDWEEGRKQLPLPRALRELELGTADTNRNGPGEGEIGQWEGRGRVGPWQDQPGRWMEPRSGI